MLAELIHPIAAMEYNDWPFRPRPSNAGPEHCLRKLGYQMFDAPQKDPHGRFLVVMDDSSWHEELVIQWLEKSVFQVHSRQLKVHCATTRWNNTDHPINGAIDGIVTDLLNVDRLLEIKAIEHFSFERYAQGAYPANYLTQITLYVRGVQQLNPEIDEALLLIKNKNQSAFLEYRLRYQADQDRLTVIELTHSNGTHTFPNQEFIGLYQQAMVQFERLETHRQLGTLADRPYENADNYHCDYCPFRKLCWEGVQRPTVEGTQPMRPELIPLIREFLALNHELGEKEKRHKTLKTQFKAELITQGVQKLIGPDGLFLSLTQSSQTRLDESLLPQALVARSKVPRPMEKLDVKQLQPTPTRQKTTKRKQDITQTTALAS